MIRSYALFLAEPPDDRTTRKRPVAWPPRGDRVILWLYSHEAQTREGLDLPMNGTATHNLRDMTGLRTRCVRLFSYRRQGCDGGPGCPGGLMPGSRLRKHRVGLGNTPLVRESAVHGRLQEIGLDAGNGGVLSCTSIGASCDSHLSLAATGREGRIVDAASITARRSRVIPICPQYMETMGNVQIPTINYCPSSLLWYCASPDFFTRGPRRK